MNDPLANKANASNCKGECAPVKATVKSDVDQTVWVAAHTWDGRQKGKTCAKTDWNIYHLFKHWESDFESGSGYSGFHDGSFALKPKEMKAGQEYTVSLEFNFNEPNAAKDWSVVAWGEKGGNMSITVSGMTSDDMPLARADGEEQEEEEKEEDKKEEDKEEDKEEEKEEEKEEDEGEKIPIIEKSENEIKWDLRLSRLHTRPTDSTDCKVGYREKYNWDNNSWDTLFKIDCPEGNNQYFDFKML